MILGLDCSRYAAEQPTGVEVYTDRIIEGILDHVDQLGYETVRCYVKTSEQLQRLLDRSEQHSQIQVIHIPRKRLWTLLGLSWELFRRPVEVFFEPSHTLPFWGANNYLWTPHGMESDHFPEAYSVFQKAYRRLSIWNAKRKNTQYIAITEAVKKDMMRFHGIPEDRIMVIWNGFDPSTQQSKNEPLSIHVTGEFLLSIGRIEKRKNQLRLIQAFEQLAEEFPQLKLVLVGGDGYGSQEVRKHYEVSSFRDRILLLGYQDASVVQYLREHALVFAYPSLVEGFGIPILEAFSAGTPVLTTKGGATEEVAGDAAVFCDPLSVDSIAKGLRDLIGDVSLRQQYQLAGTERLKQFSWERCVEQTVALLKKYP